MEDATRPLLLNEQSSGLLLVLIPLQPSPPPPLVICVNHIKDSMWVNTCALVSVHFVGLDYDSGVRQSTHRPIFFFFFNVSILNGFCICVVFIQLNFFFWWNSKRNRIVYIDLSALRFNKKEWLAVWVCEIWLIMQDYACVESNPQTGIHPFLFDFELFNVVWIAPP